MKLLCIAAVTLCVCVLLSAAVPFSQTLTQETGRGDTRNEERWTPAAAEETHPLALLRTKRQSHLSLCRYCCGCCKNKGCGYCCRF
uniref:Hepcidin antimicrobial peptide n=1 Tax=Paramormyrops kingsleyae TaxID=1676925 RepID=A0A3B3R0A3_9TELE|nr:hepcidin [Paramormyrops kingsleyae]